MVSKVSFVIGDLPNIQLQSQIASVIKMLQKTFSIVLTQYHSKMKPIMELMTLLMMIICHPIVRMSTKRERYLSRHELTRTEEFYIISL